MSEPVRHETHVQATDGLSKYGNRKRTFEAVCSCGWRSGRDRIGKQWAIEDAKTHLSLEDDLTPAKEPMAGRDFDINGDPW